jgi:hypothetical protein
MSAPSFKLSKSAGKWWATGKYSGGREFKIDCGPSTTTREKAEAKAELKLEKNVLMGDISRARWDRFRAARKASPAPAALPAPAAEPDDLAEQLAAAEEHEAPPASSSPAPAAPAPRQAHEQIRAKLLAIGDSAVPPDDVIPPGGRRGSVDDDEDEDPVDEETGQLVSEVIAGVTMNWYTRRIAKRLKKRKPPERPGEPDERMMAWTHDGIAYNLNRLIGKAVALGPTGKMIVGGCVITAQMFLDSEPLDGGAAEEPTPRERPAPAPSSPAEPEPRGNANGKPADEAAGEIKSTQLTLVPQPNPGLGTFK